MNRTSRPWLRAVSLPLLGLALLRAGDAQPDTDPETERRTFAIADGFEVALYAADPLIAKPIQMTFDARGRLWVATSSTYPHVDPSEVPDDKIVVLEDQHGAGHADHSTVFAHGLFMPTALELGDGGVYVANGDSMLFLRDRDGDGVADERHVLFSGFGTEDTHHILHTFRWGPCGDLFMNQSLYINSTIETAFGPRVLKSSGVWRLHTRNQRLEVYTRGTINPWGHCFNDWGDAFTTDGASDEAVYQEIPGESFTDWYHREPGGLGPISKRTGKLAGAEILSGRHLPDEWHGIMLSSDFRANHVVSVALREDGSGFIVDHVSDFIKSSDRAFRPVDIKMGPDGAIYLADWYNPIINHGEVDFRDPRRDRTHGRIWRITAKGRPLVEPPKLAGVKPAELIAHLGDPEQYARAQARHLLQQLPPVEVVSALKAWVQALPAAGADTPRSQLEALWVMQGLDQPDAALLGVVLASREPAARAAAVRVLADWHESIPDALDRLAALIADPHPRVRRDVVDALARIPTLRAFQLALATLDQPADALMQHSVRNAVKALAPQWTPALREHDFVRLGDLRHLGFALQASGSADAIPALAELLKSGTVPTAQRGDILAQMVRLGTPDQLAALFAPAAPEADPANEVALLAALRGAAVERKVRPAGDLATLTALFGHADAGVRAEALRLAGAWKLDAAREPAARIAGDTAAPATVRVAACDALAAFGPAAGEALATLCAGQLPPEVRPAAFAALTAADLPRALQAAPALFAADAGALTTAFLRREGGGDALAKVIAAIAPPPAAAAVQASAQALEQSGRNEPALTLALANAGATAPQHPSPEEVLKLAAQVRRIGDAKRGKAVYQQLPCAACHQVGGAGGRIGPDLTTIGASGPVDYLIDSVIYPDKQIKDGFRTLVVTTTDGAVATGILVRQDANELVLRNAAGLEESIPVGSVKSKRDGKSLMPAGLTQALTSQQFLDLIAYLASLGT